MTDRLDQLKAALAGRYEIEKEIGQGGMANVYLARDLKHDREVAVKVLRPELATALGPDRFLREIKIAANLTHPHILPLHDSGEADGFLYYVMPFIEGDTLRQRVEKEGELPIAEAVRIIKEIVDAMSFAHAQGVVHRDIKPDNIMLSGKHAMVTDFGVAKAVSEATGHNQLTTAGVALGTPAYMAPEQATADPHVDHRADIYAIGALAYELLTGRPPFIGHTPQAVLAAHVTEQVEPVSKYRDQVPPALEAVIMKCLAKKPADRWQTADEILQHLETLTTSSGGLTPVMTRPFQDIGGKSKYFPPYVVAGIAGLAIAGVFGAKLLAPEPFRLVTSNNRQITFDRGLEIDPLLTADGEEVAYSAGRPGEMTLRLKSTSGASGIVLTEGIDGNQRVVAWSPDGQTLRFQTCATGAECSMHEVGKLGGTVQRSSQLGALLSPAEINRITSHAVLSGDGLAWAYAIEDSIFVVPTSGEGRRLLAVVGEHREPHSMAWSPDGSKLAYVNGNWFWNDNVLLFNQAISSIWVISVDGGDPFRITRNDGINMSPEWLPDSRHLLFISDVDGPRDIHMAAIGNNGVLGDIRAVTSGGANPHSISISADGSRLAYSKSRFWRNVWAVPIPTSGSVSVSERRQITEGNMTIESFDVSPDGSSILFDNAMRGNADIYVMPIEGGALVALTSDEAGDFQAKWSPDGSEVAFHSFRSGNRDIWTMNADGSNLRQVTFFESSEIAPRWSRNGLELNFLSNHEAGTSRESYYNWRVNRETLTSPWSEPTRFSDVHCGNATQLMSGEGYLCGSLSSYSILDDNGALEYSFAEVRIFSVIGLTLESPDGRGVYFRYRGESGGIWWVPTYGGEPRLVVRDDDPTAGTIFAFQPVGDEMFFVLSESESDIWVMDLAWQ